MSFTKARKETIISLTLSYVWSESSRTAAQIYQSVFFNILTILLIGLLSKSIQYKTEKLRFCYSDFVLTTRESQIVPFLEYIENEPQIVAEEIRKFNNPEFVGFLNQLNDCT